MIISRWHRVLAALTVAGILSVSSSSRASITLNLTSANSDGFINGAYFLQVPDQTTGTGAIDSFERMQKDGTEHGYNTDANNVFDNKGGGFTHSLTLGAVPKTTISGLDYRAFLLDINENSGSGAEFLSLDEIQLFVGGAGNQSVTTFTGGVLDLVGSSLVYQMDAGDTGNQVALDYSLNAGSGSGDMYFYVLDSLFDGIGASANVTLYSKFGGLGVVAEGNPYGLVAGDYGNYDSSDGVEEWAVKGEGGGPGPNPPGGGEAPEPTSMIVWSLLIGAIGLAKRR